ncbi:Bug family tripartite tricarboxylate transporter substrate binding protein [Bordetella sp. H567]|uniref:Bug family tripartite tricarboxylate transporter substrate binding protein n=1 Tax=Bordetella sp. H567 TaxID=1697043 RepID=UPI00082F12B7|nr:tripartite tricarboxylate transporter substrate-binding protein [Bordetella sp. H567]
MNPLTVTRAAALALCCALAPAGHAADRFPSQPIRLIVPYAPGGASDVVARLLASTPGGGLGDRIIVENRAGGASVAGTSIVATAQPNGYTLGVVDSAFPINATLLGSKLPYDTRQDFRAVILAATSPIVLSVNKDVPAHSVADLVALAKAHPGRLNFSSAGNGTALHLAGEQFNMVTGAGLVHVPYRGGAPSVMAVVAGETQVNFSAPSTVLPHIQSGRLRALAVTGPHRLASVPDVPTFAEAGLPTVAGVISYGVIAPKGVPDDVVRTLAAGFDARLKAPDAARHIADLGFEVAGGSADDYAKFLDHEIDTAREIIRKAHITTGD